MEYSPSTCACFTGHRALTEDELKEAAARIRAEVERLYKRGIVNFYAGGALGFDLAASVTVLNMKALYPSITLNLALPCLDHTKKWRRSEIELLSRVMARADSAVYVSESYHRGCMHIRNKYMADKSSVCIAYMKEKSGGTASTVSYALKKGLEVINLADAPISDQIVFDI